MEDGSGGSRFAEKTSFFEKGENVGVTQVSGRVRIQGQREGKGGRERGETSSSPSSRKSPTSSVISFSATLLPAQSHTSIYLLSLIVLKTPLNLCEKNSDDFEGSSVEGRRASGEERTMFLLLLSRVLRRWDRVER